VGGGAAGFATAEMLCREGFGGGITMLSVDNAPPYDRPNCSKDYLAGNAPEEWMPLRPADYYTARDIDLQLSTEVIEIDPKARQVTLAGGRGLPFDKLLLATGAEPIRLNIPGANQPHVQVLRSLADSRAIIVQAKEARRAVVLGASFIGLEVAAALRAREIEVHVVAPDRRPLERVLGREYGDVVREIHEEHGVVFHLEETATEIDRTNVKLKGGATLPADLVVVGIGVRPQIQLAERAGLKIDRGVVVNEYLETNAPGDLCCRRHRAVAGSAYWRQSQDRALGGGRAPGADCGAQHSRAEATIFGRSVLLEPALRCSDQLHRPR